MGLTIKKGVILRILKPNEKTKIGDIVKFKSGTKFIIDGLAGLTVKQIMDEWKSITYIYRFKKVKK